MTRFYLTLLILSGCLFDVVFSMDSEDIEMGEGSSDMYDDNSHSSSGWGYQDSTVRDNGVSLKTLMGPNELLVANLTTDYSVINRYDEREVRFTISMTRIKGDTPTRSSMFIFKDARGDSIVVLQVSLLIRVKVCKGDEGEEKEEREELFLVFHCYKMDGKLNNALYLIHHPIVNGAQGKNTNTAHFKNFIEGMTEAMSALPPSALILPVHWLTDENYGYLPVTPSALPCMPITLMLERANGFVCRTLQGKPLSFEEPFFNHVKNLVIEGGRKMTAVPTVSPFLKHLLLQSSVDIEANPLTHLYT